MSADTLAGWLGWALLAAALGFLQASAQAGNDAQHVSNTIPASMVPGFSYGVSVTMKNTGTTTWTGGDPGYILWCTDGYNFEVYHNEARMGGSEAIAPGQDRTFEMSFVAPSAGTYTTTWKMVQEGVGAFGDPCTKQVVVAFGPNVPGAPTMVSPTHGMIMGSNRPDLKFQGDPCDAYEVHIGKCNAPNSTDGWDSGTIMLNAGPNLIVTYPAALSPQQTYYVFARLHNTHGWGPWSAYDNWFYTDGQFLNDPYLIRGNGLEWQHSMCHNPDRNEYLIAWQNGYIIYYRLLDGTGTMIGNEMHISDDLGGHQRPSVCYNSARHEYLIEYSGWASQDQVRVLRIDPVTADPIGGPTVLYTTGNIFAVRSAYSPTSNLYFVTWEAYSEGTVYGQILNSTAVPTSAIFKINTPQYFWCRNQYLAWNSTSDEYLVTFQGGIDEPHSFDFLCQRVRASDGALLGSNVVLSGELGPEGPGGVAYDSDMNRYFVAYEGGPWGQFISASGTLVGARFLIGSGYYSGWGPTVTRNPVTKEYLVTWAASAAYSDFARRISQTGAFVGETFETNGDKIGTGNWNPISVYNPTSNEFLICWFNSYKEVYVRRYKSCPLPPPDVQPPGPVTNLTLSRTPPGMNLSWTNPSTPDFSATMVRVKTGSLPVGPTDGRLVVDKPNCPGITDTLMDTAEPKGTLLCYAAFARDRDGNYADAATACGTLVGGDFDGDNDVDQQDFGHLQACLSGSGMAPGPGCEDADLDIDGDVDQDDFAAFRACMGGPIQAPGC
jgi:hypothetical protein